ICGAGNGRGAECRGVLSPGSRARPPAAGEVARAARGHEFEPTLGQAGKDEGRADPARRHLRLVHRRARHARPERSEIAAREPRAPGGGLVHSEGGSAPLPNLPPKRLRRRSRRPKRNIERRVATSITPVLLGLRRTPDTSTSDGGFYLLPAR